MNTIERLAKYRAALERWSRQMKVRQLDEQAGHHHKKPLEPEPPMQQFEIPADDTWALKIRAEVLKVKPIKSLPPKRKSA